MKKGELFRAILEQPDEELWNYNALDCEVTWEAAEALIGDMALFKGARETHDRMLKLSPAVHRMTERGLPVNAETRKAMAERTKAGLELRTAIINEAFVAVIGQEYDAIQAVNNFFRRFFNKRRRDVKKPFVINPRSKPQLVFLLQRLGFKWAGETPTGRKQLDLDIVMKLRRQHGDGRHAKLLETLWEFAKLEKVRSDWLDDPEHGKLLCNDGRMRASARVCGTASGRLSESVREWCATCQAENHGRNRQNAPKSDDPLLASYCPIRSMIEAPEGFVFVERDYDSFEAWLAAVLSGDKVFLKKLESGDIHRMNAADMFQTTPEKVTELQRQMGKILIYGGALYEGGPETIQSSFEEHGLVVPLADIKLYQARWKTAHHGYVQACHNLIMRAMRSRPMHVTTALGRRRNFIGNQKSWRRDAIAHWISGTGVDHVNEAMIELDAKGYAIVLHGHDSLVTLVEDNVKAIDTYVHDSRVAFAKDRGVGFSFPSSAKTGKTLGRMEPWPEI